MSAGYAVGLLDDVVVGPAVVEYIERIEATFAPFGGRWLVHGSEPVALEGVSPEAIVVIAFPSVEAVRAWFRSPAYAAIAPLRTDHSTSVVAALEGVPEGYRAADTAARLRTRDPQ